MNPESIEALDRSRQLSIIEGLKIFSARGIWGVQAIHDELLAGPEPDATTTLTDDDKKRLETLGWFEDPEHGCWGFFT